MNHKTKQPAVVFTGASVQLGRRVIWRDANITLAGGEFVAILGPNGAGKSTLIKATLGMVPLADGQVQVLGRPAGASKADIGYLPQRRNFDGGLRIRGVDVVRLGLDGNRWGLPLPEWFRSSRGRVARVQEVIRLVDAQDYAERPIGELSGGEQQRLLIAQALASRPKLLLLDEPLDSLDLPNQTAVAALIQRVCREEGVTVLMVAHDVNPILNYLDAVVYVARGGVVAGHPHKVITSETLSRLYDSPVEVLKTSTGRLVVVGEPEAPAAHGNRHGEEVL